MGRDEEFIQLLGVGIVVLRRLRDMLFKRPVRVRQKARPVPDFVQLNKTLLTCQTGRSVLLFFFLLSRGSRLSVKCVTGW